MGTGIAATCFWKIECDLQSMRDTAPDISTTLHEGPHSGWGDVDVLAIAHIGQVPQGWCKLVRVVSRQYNLQMYMSKKASQMLKHKMYVGRVLL